MSIENTVNNTLDFVSDNLTIGIPLFTIKEESNYLRQKDKAKFSSPKEEWMWASSQEKVCSKCHIEKKLCHFNGNTSGTDAFDKEGYRLRRPECSDCTKKVGYGKQESVKLAKSLGIPYKAPEGTKCARCCREPSKGNGLVFDHDHEKNVFRGYLCNSCNRSIGVLGDDIEGAILTLNYLLKQNPVIIKQNSDGQIFIEK